MGRDLYSGVGALIATDPMTRSEKITAWLDLLFQEVTRDGQMVTLIPYPDWGCQAARFDLLDDEDVLWDFLVDALMSPEFPDGITVIYDGCNIYLGYYSYRNYFTEVTPAQLQKLIELSARLQTEGRLEGSLGIFTHLDD